MGVAVVLNLVVAVELRRAYRTDHPAQPLPHWPDDLELPIP